MQYAENVISSDARTLKAWFCADVDRETEGAHFKGSDRAEQP